MTDSVTKKKRGSKKKAAARSGKKAAVAAVKKAAPKANKKSSAASSRTATKSKKNAKLGSTSAPIRVAAPDKLLGSVRLPDDKNVADVAGQKAGKKVSKKLGKKAGKKGGKKVAKSAGPRAEAWARPPGQPPQGTARTDRAARKIASLVIAECAKSPRGEGAKRLGIEPTDLKNIIAGNRPGIRLVMRLITNGRVDPEALILKHKIKQLPPDYDLSGARVELIAERVRLIAKSFEAARLADRTGLPTHTIYQHRKLGHPVGLVTLLAYIDGGASPNYLFLGET